jgi:hypothetical protein
MHGTPPTRQVESSAHVPGTGVQIEASVHGITPSQVEESVQIPGTGGSAGTSGASGGQAEPSILEYPLFNKLNHPRICLELACKLSHQCMELLCHKRDKSA